MCGICGFSYRDSPAPSNKEETIQKMMATIKHRGPDESGHFCDSNTALGHQRLSIIDLKSGQQPLFSEDKKYAIIFNGEIYNFKNIRDELKNKGMTFKTHSDTEVILKAYIAYGETCVEYLRGMFAFVIYNCETKKLFAARDRLGIKPFYFTYKDYFFCFGSEIKPIIESTNNTFSVSYEALSDYLSFMYIPAPKTIFKDIQKLPAGHFLTLMELNLQSRNIGI